MLSTPNPRQRDDPDHDRGGHGGRAAGLRRRLYLRHRDEGGVVREALEGRRGTMHEEEVADAELDLGEPFGHGDAVLLNREHRRIVALREALVSQGSAHEGRARGRR